MTTAPRAPVAAKTRARILCIDDEPAVVAALDRQLHYHFSVAGATSGAQGLALLEVEAFAVIVSDMRMPTMDGAEVLARARALRPDTTRVLLTGHADLEATIAAVNRGNVFRFLVKPCTGLELRRALDDAVELHRHVTAERELLEGTLRGAIAALGDALALANPVAFARATRIQALVRALIEARAPDDAWQIEVAATLAQLGTVALDQQTLEKLYRGLPLSAEELHQVDELPRLAERLLTHIPRLDAVRRIIRGQQVPFARAHYGDPPSPTVVGSQMLRVATALDALEAAGLERRDALITLARDGDLYDPELLLCLVGDDIDAAGDPLSRPRPVALGELQIGWTIEEDVHDGLGRLIIGRGHVVTESLVQRLANWRGPTLPDTVLVSETGQQ